MLSERITKEEMAVAYTVSRGRFENLPENINRVLGDARSAREVKTGSDKVFNRMVLESEAKQKNDLAQLVRDVAVAPDKNIFAVTGFEKAKGKRK